jgi:hypothetical protein
MKKQMDAQNKKSELTFAFLVVAEWTGFEPATPGVTGRYSNRLNYHSLILHNSFLFFVVGADGLEPPTSSL